MHSVDLQAGNAVAAGSAISEQDLRDHLNVQQLLRAFRYHRHLHVVIVVVKHGGKWHACMSVPVPVS